MIDFILWNFTVDVADGIWFSLVLFYAYYAAKLVFLEIQQFRAVNEND